MNLKDLLVLNCLILSIVAILTAYKMQYPKQMPIGHGLLFIKFDLNDMKFIIPRGLE